MFLDKCENFSSEAVNVYCKLQLQWAPGETAQLAKQPPSRAWFKPQEIQRDFVMFWVQALLVLSISWTFHTLVKIGWTCRTSKKWKIFSGLHISFGQSILWKSDGCFIQETERGKPENISYTGENKRVGVFFPFKRLICLLIHSKFFCLNFKAEDH